MSSGSDFFLALLAILFPPIAVWIKRSICSLDALLNLFLCFLGYIPGLLHAWYIIYAYPDEDAAYVAVPQDAESGGGRAGNVTYYYVGVREGQGQEVGAPKPREERAYGTLRVAEAEGSASAGAGAGAGAGPSAGPSAGASAGPNAGRVGEEGQAEGREREGVPPSYAEAVMGDHKIQV